MSPQPVILDTDPGIDDALAILLALASPEIELLAVTVTGGNCPLDQGVRNALSVLELARADVPVYAGVAVPLLRPPLTAPETHGEGGLGRARLPAPQRAPAAEHAVDYLVRTIMQAAQPLTLVAVAPLTNLALAIRREPRIVQRLREVIVMGGAFEVPGNTTPLAEFNVYVDPHAAAIVLHSGLPLTIIPWDITAQVLLTPAHIEQVLQAPGPIPRFIAEATSFYIDFHRDYFGAFGCAINDPCALALAFRPELARTESVFVDVETDSPRTLGKTFADVHGALQRPPNARLVRDFDREAFLDLFVQRMIALAHRHAA